MKEEMKHEDEFLKSLFTQSAEKPEGAISEKVMVKIHQTSNVFEYKPLISKRSWIVIGSVFVLAMAFMIFGSEGIAVQTPELLKIFSGGLIKLKNNFQFQWSVPQLPEIPTALLISLVAFNVIGVYLMIYYRLSRKI